MFDHDVPFTRKQIYAFDAAGLLAALVSLNYSWAEATKAAPDGDWGQYTIDPHVDVTNASDIEIAMATDFLLELCNPCLNCPYGLYSEKYGCSSDYGSCGEKLTFRDVPVDKWPCVRLGPDYG